MKDLLADKKNCTGCAACANICPNHCIQMKEDETGFFNPVIDESKCVGCNVCVNVCPTLNKKSVLNKSNPTIYGAKCIDEETRFKSTSGGIFASLARGILHEKGIVVGAIYDTPFCVRHEIAHNETQLEPLLQSKYVQSQIDLIYTKIEECLKDGTRVLFCGTPCQVAGLYSYLGKSYDNLLTCDFVCYGVNSPKAYRAWLKEYETVSKKVKRVWFKYKINGWYNSPLCTRIDFTDDTNIVLDENDNIYMAGYIFESLFIRQCCGDCQFKGLPRIADITLGDFWGIDQKLDDDKGTSIVMINNDKGKDLFETIKSHLIYWEADLDAIKKSNHMIQESVNINPSSTEFLKELDYHSFSNVFSKYSTDNLNHIKW